MKSQSDINVSPTHPVMFSYRRCPYAMRARIGIYLCQQQVEQREIVFWDKPEMMVKASPKGTVPVLLLSDGTVIDESRDILYWAIQQSATEASLYPLNKRKQIDALIDFNDDEFKEWLDRYKYADRYPEASQQYYRQKGEVFFSELETLLVNQTFLTGDELSLADIALMPFIRQFAHVDKVWFESAEYPKLGGWLNYLMNEPFFKAVMKNRPVWELGHQPLWVDEPELMTRDQFSAKAQSKSREV